MGKGDIKSKRGKISNGTFGVRRPHNKIVASPAPKVKNAKKSVKAEAAPKATTAGTKKKATKK